MDSTKEYLNLHLNRYEVHERLGTGGMARVYRGYDRNLDRPVAIKILHEHLADEPMFIQRFQREAKYIAALNHPNIVQVFDYNTMDRQNGNVCYMVMSYIEGQSLREVLEKATEADSLLPHKQVERIMLDLLSALEYAHQQGMVHRDVKPANILIDPQGKAILTDFGIAYLGQYTKLTQEGSAIGTPAYMSPEQANGDTVDGRSDYYAAGIILYEMLTGCPPFVDDGSLSVLLKHLNDPVPSLAETGTIEHPYMDAVIFKALAKDPKQRYQTATEFAEDIQAAFAGKKPKVIASSTAVLDTPHTLPAANSTQDAIPSIVPAPTNLVSSRIILAGTILFAAILLFIVLLSQRADNATVEPTPFTAGVESMVESMVGAGPIYFETDFAEDDYYLSMWPQDSLRDLTRIMDEGTYHIINQRSGEAIATLFNSPEDYEDIIISMEARLESSSTPNSAYGIIFRYVDNDNYNVLAVDGIGRYSIWVRENGQWQELRDAEEAWTLADGIATIGDTNMLEIQIDHDTLTAFINDQRITQVEDETLSSGKVGIYVASPESGIANVRILNYAVSIHPPNRGVESMVGER